MDGEYPTENLQTDKVMSPTEAAYFAGMVDGEGSIAITRVTRKGQRRRIGWEYFNCFEIANSNLELLLWLRAACGNGRINSNFHVKVKDYHRTVYQLRLWSHQTRHILPQLLPYLVGKRKQAELMLAHLAHTKKSGGEAKSQEYWQAIENTRVAIANLNRRGGSPVQVPTQIIVPPSKQGVNQWSPKP